MYKSRQALIILGLILAIAVALPFSGSRQLQGAQSSCQGLNPGDFCVIESTGSSFGYDLAFSPDSTKIAFTAGQTASKIYDTSGRLLSSISGFIGYGIAFSPDSGTLAIGTETGVRLFDASSGSEIARFEGVSGRVNTIAYSPSGDLMTAGTFDSALLLWDVVTGELLAHTQIWDGTFAEGISEVSFISDTRLVASGDFNTHIFNILNDSELRFMRELESGLLTAGLSVSPNGQYIATSGGGNSVLVWRADNFEIVQSWDIVAEPSREKGAYTIAFGNDNSRLYIGEIHTHSLSNGGLQVWNVNSGELERRLTGTLAHIEHLSISRDNRWAASFTNDQSNYVMLWRLR